MARLTNFLARQILAFAIGSLFGGVLLIALLVMVLDEKWDHCQGPVRFEKIEKVTINGRIFTEANHDE